MASTLVFVYNANGGLFNTLADVAHKIFSPETYACNLCALTHSNFGMRKEWRQFVESLGGAVEFLHADELKERYGVEGVRLPVIFSREDESLRELVGAAEINNCRTMEELEQLILEKLSRRPMTSV
jgi:hypothetical protein